MKRWLVIKNSHYYPNAGTGDWDGPYEHLSDARREALEWEASESTNSAEVINLFTWIGFNVDNSDD